jgi:hypothetical protein
MIDTVAALARAREVAHRTAREAYPASRPDSRRRVFELTVTREFADLCLPGGYASLIGYAGDTKGGACSS